MATSQDNTRFFDLRARLAAINCELLEEEGTHAERYVIFDKAKGLIISCGSTIEDQYDWLGLEEKARAAGADNVLRGLEPSASEANSERQEITVLVGNHCDTIYGIHGVARALVALDEPESLELAIALRALSKRLYSGLGSLLSDAERKIAAATGMTVRS